MTLSGRHLVLTGPMASGKTTLGRILARRLGRRFFDSDEQIVEQLGVTGRRLAAEQGVDVLHEHEARALIEALAEDEPAVIAAAASTADSPSAVTALRESDASLVLVEAPEQLLMKRLAKSGHRRDISAAEFIARTRDRRQVLVGLRPAALIDTSLETPEASAESVIHALAEMGD